MTTPEECYDLVVADSSCDAGLGNFTYEENNGTISCHCCTSYDALTNTSQDDNSNLYGMRSTYNPPTLSSATFLF